jgi:hypothetical protein
MLQIEVLVLLALLRSAAYGGAIGVLLGITKRLTRTASFATPKQLICSIVNKGFLRLFEQAVASWVPSSAGLRGIQSFAVALVSTNTLSIVVYIVALVLLMYLLIKKARGAARIEGLQA